MSENRNVPSGNDKDGNSIHEKLNYRAGVEAALKSRYDDVYDSVETLVEMPLGQEHPILDLLVLKKDPKLKLGDDIGSFFRENNIIEVKGHGDGISINDVFKSLGYADMYISIDKLVDQIPWESVTVTVIQFQYPRAALAQLQERDLHRCQRAWLDSDAESERQRDRRV